ncbi:MAG: acyl-CoA dehydrogenase [Acidimicrobiia bacterium]
MAIAISDEHRELERVARAFLDERGALAAARALLDAPTDALPTFWSELAGLGWLGLHLPEVYGGQGYSTEELAVVLEELGRVAAPGPFLPTVIASQLFAACGGDKLKSLALAGMAGGSIVAGVGLAGSLVRAGDTVSGDAGVVLGAELAQVLVLVAGDDVVIAGPQAAGIVVANADNADRGRRSSRVTLSSTPVDSDHVIIGGRSALLAIARSLAAAEAAGIARACTEMAVAYAKVREQFGRTIGTFQAVKHHAANMLVATELATAAAWDAARALPIGGAEAELAGAVAAAIALPAALKCAQLNIQLHGGIGFTWEHDAHVYLRRAIALNALVGGASDAGADVTRLKRAGVERQFAIALPPEAQQYRAEAQAFVATWKALPQSERRKALVDSGYLQPHWPVPFGRAAGPVEQLVIDEEFADVDVPGMGIGGWVTLTIAQSATPDQIERWIRPSMLGDDNWCQLFSEPNAGSDAASVQTRGVRVDGGWIVNGQKVWTSGAQNCTKGFATVRTDPDAPKHAGVTMMAIDLKAKGVEVRPLREITGHALFNEVFFDDVFVPDDDVVGQVNQGWKVARNTLGNERVSIGSGKGGGNWVLDLVALVERHDATVDAGHLRSVGEVLAEGEAMHLMNLRTAVRAVAGGEPGPEGNITKLLSAEHAQRAADVALAIAGDTAALLDGADADVAYNLIFTRCLSIAGGTSEITRNQIAERLLGLPRDPLLR